MKFLHTSDWHLGASDNNLSLWDDQKFFIDEICKIIEAEEIDALLISGDVYDRSVVSVEALNLYDYAITKICVDMGVRVYEIAGNHDSADRLSNLNKLHENSGLYVAGAIERKPSVYELDDVQIFLLPWFTKEKVKTIFPEKVDEIATLEDAYRVVTTELKEHFADGKKHIVLSHAFITDSETSTSDRAAEIGTATQVGASVFDGFDYVALGHIHKPQNVSDRIRYCGTPMPYSFGKEEKQDKGVTIVDTDTMDIKHVSLPLLHTRRTFEGTLEEIKKPDCTAEERDGYVRLNITDCYVGAAVINELRNIYPNLLEVSGKSYEGEETTISLTMEEFEKMESDPMEIFRHFCLDQMDEEPDDHKVELFREAVAKVEEENA
ncbi:MAG: exonuclease SbcCD subunit D [Clostridiales bacterium]|nr:exonuclease SbcCD subunit D [Clostridiales bacterium]